MSLDFEDSSAEYLRHDTACGITDYPFTLCAWFNVESTPGASGHCIMQLTARTGSDYQTLVIANSSGIKLALTSRDVANAVLIGTTALSTSTWYFGAGVFFADADRKVYINAVQDGTNTTNANFAAGIDTLYVGAQDHTGSPLGGSYMDGLIAYPQVYNRALSPEELKEVMHKPWSVADGLVFSLDTFSSFSAATDIKDLSGQGNDIDAGTLPDRSFNEPPVYFPVLNKG